MRPGRRRAPAGTVFALGLAAGVVALLFFAWLAREMLAGATLQFDDTIRIAVHRHASPELTAVMRLFTFIGTVPVIAALTLGLVIACWWMGWIHGAVLFLITMGGAGVLDFTLKLAFHRARPVPFFETPVPHSYSFPSGHALFSFCLFAAFATLISSKTPGKAARAAAWLVAVVFIGVIGLSRIYLGVHYPSDVVAGYTAAFVWMMAVAAAYRLWNRRTAPRR